MKVILRACLLLITTEALLLCSSCGGEDYFADDGVPDENFYGESEDAGEGEGNRNDEFDLNVPLFSGQASSTETVPPVPDFTIENPQKTMVDDSSDKIATMQGFLNDFDLTATLASADKTTLYADANTLFKENIKISLPKVVLKPASCVRFMWWRVCTPEVSVGPVDITLIDLEASLVNLNQGELEITEINLASGNSQQLGPWEGLTVNTTTRNVNFGLEIKSHVFGLTDAAKSILKALNMERHLDALDGNFTTNLFMARFNSRADVSLVANGSSTDATIVDIETVDPVNFGSDFVLNIDLPDAFNVFGFGLAQSCVNVITNKLVTAKDFLVKTKLLGIVGPAITNVITSKLPGLFGPGLTEVDFSKNETPESMMGFLHGVEDANLMLDKHRDPLLQSDISWRVRGIEEIVEDAWDLGVKKPIVVVSDTWNGEAPGRNWYAWEEHVRNLARTFRTDVIYDIVNEPDNPIFWTSQNGHHPIFGWADLHETFKRAHDVIRAELGEEALISGPSFTFLWASEGRLFDFVRYCSDNNLKIQILSVHTIYQTDSFLDEVSKTLRRYRNDFINSENFKGAGVEYIHVNEYGLPNDFVRPGTIVATLRELEKGKVDGANRASWGVRAENCNSVDGYVKFAIDPPNQEDRAILGDIMFSHAEPRPVWWVYKYYADGVDSRVKASTTSKFLMPIASSESDEPDQAQVIIGTHDSLLCSALHSALRTNPKEIELKLANLYNLPFITPDTQHLEIEVKKIINDETAPLMSLPTVVKRQVEINSAGAAILKLDPLGDFEVYVVLLRKPQ